MSKKMGLGQGVGLLFAEEKEKYFDCDVSKIIPNKHQPRSQFNQQDMEELAQSIREKGIIQPLIITANDGEQHYELVAGERRLRAAKMAGLTHVPVVVIDIEDENSLLELALIENVQRKDLNPVEEAEAYKNLIEKFGYTQEETAKRVGKERSSITNLLRLLKLPKTIQGDISSGILSEGHGRALVRLVQDPHTLQEVRDMIVKNTLTVRQAERIIKKLSTVPTVTKKTLVANSHEISREYGNALATQLTNHLNSKVTLHTNGGRGKIEIEYYSLDDLERVFSILLGQNSLSV